MAYKYITDDKAAANLRILEKFGDNSFGTYFSHIAEMSLLNYLPYYSKLIFPINACVVVCITNLCVELGKMILGKYFAL